MLHSACCLHYSSLFLGIPVVHQVIFITLYIFYEIQKSNTCDVNHHSYS